MDHGQEEIAEQSDLPSEELIDESETLKKEISGQSLNDSYLAPSFSIMSVNQGNYSPDNWSSGYRIYTADSADKRAELFNDFSYFMVRKFEIEVDTRHNNDVNIINLVNDVASNNSFLNTKIDNNQKSVSSGISSLQNQINTLDTWLNTKIDNNQKSVSSSITSLQNQITNNKSSASSGITSLQGQINTLDSWLNTKIDNNQKSASSSIESLQNQVTDNKSSAGSGIASLQSQITDNQSGVNSSVSSLQSQINAITVNSATGFVDLISTLNNRFREYFFADGSGYGGGIVENDGVFTKVIKGQTNRIIDSIKSNKYDDSDFKQFFRVLTYSSDYSAGIISSDGSFVQIIKGQFEKIDSLKTELINVGSKIKDYSTLLTTLNLSTLANATSINNFSNENAENLTFIYSTLKGLKNYDDSDFKQLIRETTYSSDYSVGIIPSDGSFVKTIKGQFEKIDLLKTELINVGNKIKDYTTLLTTLNLSTLANATSINNFSNENAENLTFINSTLSGLKNYDDSDFKQFFRESTFSSDYSVGINSSDGSFVKIVKGQFALLIAELNRQLTLSFTASTNNMDSFKTYLREEFALLNDWSSLQVDWSTMINENILLAIAALDKLFAKPNGDVNVSVPAFDFDRLQKILDALSFGNVVNEAGTNLWDVLKELIDALGGVVEAVVGIVPDLIDKLIGLIIPENPNFFSEDVEALTSAFDMKFDWAFNLSDSFKSVFSQPKSIKSLTVPIGGKEYKVVPDVVDLNIIKTIFTGYFCFLTLFTSYKRIVGGGDVIQ